MNFATKEDAWFQGRKFSPKVFPSTSTTSSTCHSILRHTWPLLLLVRPPIVLRRPVISIVNRYDTSSLHHGLRSKINLEFVGDIEPIHNFFPPINSSSYFSSRLSLLEIYVFRSIEKFLRAELSRLSPPISVIRCAG